MVYSTLSDYRLTREEVCLVIRNLPITLAEKIINLNSYELRFIAKDFKSFAVTSDIKNNRITIATMCDVVIEASPY